MAVCAAVKDLRKAIGDSIAIIARIPKDELGQVTAYEVEDGQEIISSVEPSCVFERFTAEERHALSAVVRKHRAAAKRLASSIAAAREVWAATLAEYKRNERIAPAAKAGGRP
jgi:hypothetical protein